MLECVLIKKKKILSYRFQYIIICNNLTLKLITARPSMDDTRCYKRQPGVIFNHRDGFKISI